MYAVFPNRLLSDVLDQTRIHLLYSQINNCATYNIIICTHLFSGVYKMSSAKSLFVCIENHSSFKIAIHTISFMKKVNFLVAN